jgi:DNA repair exonuclease SbcCD ATPase subunit
VINNRPNWDKIKRQIDEIEQYEQVADIHDLFRRYSQLNPVYHQQQGVLLDAHRQWDQEHADLTQKIQSNNQQIEHLKQNLVYSTNELDYNRHIKQWGLYHQTCHRITQLQNVVYLDQLRVVETSLSQVDLKRQYQSQHAYWLLVRDNKSKYLNKCELSLQVSKLLPIIQTLSVQYETDTHFYDLFIKKNQEIITYDRLLSVIVAKKDKINFIYKTLANYRIWLYREIVIPKIITTVNNLVSVVTECSEYSLTTNITVDRYNKVVLNWSITSPSGSSSIEKSGGFRKYIYGLIMRISLTQMGCSHINNTQLFLDEGFTSCDLYNLDKMPQFLGNLLDFFPKGIVLVSHLLTIRECANKVVEIQQNPDKTSRIVFERGTYPIDKPKLVLRKQHSI